MTKRIDSEILAWVEFAKGGEGSGRYPKGSGETTKPTVGMSMSEYHMPRGGSAYHHIITSVSPSGHKFEARMVLGSEGAGLAIGVKLAAAKSQAEREAIIRRALEDRILSSQVSTYTRRRTDGSYQPIGASGWARPTVTLNSTYTQQLWD